MDVVLNLSKDQIFAINSLLNKVYHLPFYAFDEEQKAAISIGALLSDKFDKKVRSIRRKAKTTKTSFRITLKYHEAWALKNICINQIMYAENQLQKVSIQSAINELDQSK
ncbi:hypothetical protein [Tenacibaculum maritimum]|uniref:hypothetical protein n=1 Tax=Tenacibaculum maritimum TaxID=107401 RepID=UPI00388E4BCD